MGRAYLSLGANIAAEANLRSAVRALRDRFGIVEVSLAYRTPAVGFNGPDFLNAAAIIESDLDALALNAWLHALEDAHGRDRSGARFSDRPLDIDIVFYDGHVLAGQAQVARGIGLAHATASDQGLELVGLGHHGANGHMDATGRIHVEVIV